MLIKVAFYTVYSLHRLNYIFWTDVAEDAIWRAHLNGVGAIELVDDELVTPGMLVTSRQKLVK